MQLDRHGLGAVREQVQLHVRMLGRRAAQHRAHQPRLELLQPPHGFERDQSLRVQRFAVRVAAEQALILGERRLDLGVLGQRARCR